MSDAMVPSYRVARDQGRVPWRMMAMAGGVVGVAALGAAGWMAYDKMGGGSVPVVEADPKPIKVKPADPGGLRVPNQGEMILERPQARPQTAPNRGAELAPPAETPAIDRLRAQVAPPSVFAPAPQAALALPEPAPEPAVAAPPVPRPVGRVQVQLGALPNEASARAEWDRLSRRAPALFQERTSSVLRLDREGQAPLFRLRTGGFPDVAAARDFCGQVTATGGACVVIP
jgi:hypothetical protein